MHRPLPYMLFLGCCAVWSCLSPVNSLASEATEEFSFELEEFEKQPLKMGGYIEAKWEHVDINQHGALARLNYYGDPISTLDRLTASIQLDGSYIKGKAGVHWLLKGAGQYEEGDWLDTLDIFEAYASLKPTNNLTTTLGKKSYKWGKGYAWNPVGFLNRPKDPNNPEEALEGYITAEADVIKSFTGALQNLALTTTVLPLWDGVNDDFGQVQGLNLAAKLYLLYKDTDFDLLFFAGDSRSTRLGVDFSRNIATNFEIHGEYAYVSDFEKTHLEEDGSTTRRQESAHSMLLGLRYLSESNLTSIVEYYHNGSGYTEDELARFYQLVDAGGLQFTEWGMDNLLQNARKLGLQGYTRPYLGRDYLYGRFSLKEPWDILYFTPALTTILNLNDQSYTLTPELLYTGFTNVELRLRFSYLNGGGETEYGEKQNESKLELRVRYFF